MSHWHSGLLKNPFIMNLSYFMVLFRIDDTFEMRTSELVEICISIDDLRMVARVFISNRKKGEKTKIAERQRECVCVRASVDGSNSVGF